MKGVLQMDGYEKLMEQYDEAAFALMMDRSAEEEGAELLRMFREASDAGALPEYSDALDRRCRDSIEREFGKRTRRVRLRRFGQSLVRAAVLVFAMIGLAGTLIMSVEAWRAPFLDALIERYGEYSLFLFDKEEEITSNDMVKVFESLLDKEYKQVANTITEHMTLVTYENTLGNVAQLYITPAGGMASFDTEDAIVSDIYVADYQAVLVEKAGYQVIWVDTEEQQLYTVHADGMSKDAVLNICNILASLD